MLGKGWSYLFGRGRTTAYPQCNRLQLSALLRAHLAVPLLGPQSATPKARNQPGSQEGRRGTPTQDCTSDALACLRMQPVSPWQLGMLPPPGPTGSSSPPPCCAYQRWGQSITPIPTQPPPSPEPPPTQPASSAAFFSHQNCRLRADCSKILPMGERGQARHSSRQSISIVPGPDQGCPAWGLMEEHCPCHWGAPAGWGACPRWLAAGCMGLVHPRAADLPAGSPGAPCPG